MDFGSLLHGVGDFIGSILGQKKQTQNQQPQAQPVPKPFSIGPSHPNVVGSISTQQPQQQFDPNLNNVPTAPLNLGGVNRAQQAPTVKQPSNFLNDALHGVQDFTAQANDALYGGLIKGGANIANSIATGFNQDETAKRTNDFLHTIGQNQNADGQSQLAVGTNKNSTAGQLGQAVGQVEKGVAETVPSIVLPGAAGATVASRLGLGAAGNAASGFLQGAAGNGSLKDDIVNGGVNAALGAGGAILPDVLKGVRALTTNDGRSVGDKVVDGIIDKIGRTIPGSTDDAARLASDPSTPITTAPANSTKPAAITSPNRPAPTAAPAPAAPVVPAAPAIPSVAPVAESPLGRGGLNTPAAPQIIPTVLHAADKTAAQATTAEQAIARGGAPVPVTTKPLATKPAPKAPGAAPKPAPAASTTKGELGSITHNAVVDGSINTPEGITATITKTESAARDAATQAGDTLENIIKKGQTAYDLSKSSKKGLDLTPAEAEKAVKGFTPAQQAVYKSYSQEIGTLRDRAGYSLKGGNQGAWYGPRQALDETGESQAFDPSIVNEIRRQGNGSAIPTSELDLSNTPYSHAIQRYANAPDAGAQVLIDRAENDATGAARGFKVPDEAKEQLKNDLADVTAKRDEALRLQRDGNTAAAKQLSGQIESDINKTFNKFADAIPGSGKARNQAIADVKELRDPYMQSSMESLALSNVTNRVADQGSALLYKSQQPGRRLIDKVLAPVYKAKAQGFDPEATGLNTSKAAIDAAKQTASGTLMHEVSSNFKANMSLAGAGRNPIVKGIAKIDALPRATTSAATQLGDISTPNTIKALQIGASRPEAQGLKTVADYKQYYADYMKTDKFKQDLEQVNASNNSRIGIAGNTGKNDGGTVSKNLSKYVDNGIKTGAAAIDAEHGTNFANNRLVNEANGYVKSNITGFAGVGSRILGFTGRSATFKGIRDAAKIVKSGDPAAAAKATQLASQSIMDAGALYGGAGAAALAVKAGGGVIGYTGAGGKQGSSDSAYNKANGVPRDKWYINLPGGNRVYFDPARALGAPGAAADIVGGALTGDGVTGAKDAATNLINQVGGSSLPQTAVNVQTEFDPSAPDQDAKYAGEQLQQTLAPATGLLNNVANWTDPTKRAPTNFLDDLKSNLPVLRSQTPAATDSQGNTLPNAQQISGGSSQLQFGKNPDAPVSQDANGPSPLDGEISRLQKLSGNVFPTSSNTNATDPGIKDLANTLVNDPIYKAADDKGKASMLKDVLAGTSTKGINSSLPATDKQALLDHKVLGDKAKAWLDDNKNAANYYTADYDNSKANGTLTEADEDLTNTSGAHYKAVVAQVDAQTNATYGLKKDYSGTSQTEFKNMLNPDSDSYDIDKANQIYAYDKARADAGLPAKYDLQKAKDAIAKAAAKGKGSGTGSNFAFASLPSSLVGTNAGSSSGSSKYSDPTSLYQPVASLKTPATTQIPKGRSISVSKIQTL